MGEFVKILKAVTRRTEVLTTGTESLPFPQDTDDVWDFLFTSKTGKRRNVERDIPINGSAVTEQFGETAVSFPMSIPLYLFPNIYTNSATTI